jgi:alpha-1,3-rhamnosyl/mannosyltransferase
MAASVPVLTSNTSCLPEVAGPGALCVDPKSVSALTAALERLLENAELRTKLAADGRSWAERYRWETCARESWEFFRGVIS